MTTPQDTSNIKESCNCGMGCNPMHPPCKDHLSQSNISNELDEILSLVKYKIIYGTTHGGCPPRVEAVERHGVKEARQALTAHIQQECDRARIDEVKMCQQVLRGGKLPVVASIFDSRLRELKDLNQGGEADVE